MINRLNIIFLIELFFVVLIAVGIMPREGALFLAIFLSAIFAFIFSLEESVFLTARSIPLFLALPITESFDNFNIWRILILVLFIKWLVAERAFLKKNLPPLWPKFRLEILAGILAFIAVLSLIKAEDPIAGVKRIIYFANMGMLFLVVRHIVNRGNFMALGKNFIISGIIAASVGIIQLVSAYLMPINNFAEYWALTVERNLYGNAWAQIAIYANTWFAYFNNTIHLRMFSSFPDSHSFPLYLLIVSVFVATFISFKRSLGQNCKPAYILLGIFSLCIVLSGTRGIWAAAILPILILIYYWIINYRGRTSIVNPPAGGLNLKILWLPIIFFIAALIISQPIFNSKQFKLIENETEESRVLINRLVSIFDTEETSNQGRIWIWTESIKSIAKNPLLGVGIGNFPTVLDQDIALAKAGSSAHNLFLQVLAEMGVFAFAVFLMIIYEIFKKARELTRFNLDRPEAEPLMKFFGIFSIMYLGWIIAYTMTDPAIFDERVFLALMILIGTIFALADSKSSVILSETKDI